MTQRLVLSELRILLEHFTTAEKPDPDFMRSHASALLSAVDSWADEQDQYGEQQDETRQRDVTL